MPPPASADAIGPAVTYFRSPIPIIGSTLSDASGTPSLSLKNGWTINDGDGICSASTSLYRGYPLYSTTPVWSAPTVGSSVIKTTGKYQWSAKVGRYDYLTTSASDCLGNASSYAYTSVAPVLEQEGKASFGAGWSTTSCSCFSGGSAMKSSTVGAKATYTFSYSPLVSLVSNSASDRGTVSLSVDGGTPVNVNLNGTNITRKIVWNSKYLNPSGTHLLTVKVVSGRVDIDGFLTQ